MEEFICFKIPQMQNLVQNVPFLHKSENKCSVTVFMVHCKSQKDSRKTLITGTLVTQTQKVT